MMTALDKVLEAYRDMFGVKTETANEIHRDACIEVERLREIARAELAAKDAALVTAREALTDAVEVIHLWHNMDVGEILTTAEHDVTWMIYQKNSPEMKRIFSALAALDATP